VRQLQRRLWVAAKRSPERRFHALLDRIYRRDVLWEAWRRVKRNRGAAGVDRETLDRVEQYGVERRLDELHVARRAGTYRPQPVLRRYIPKTDLGTLVRYADDFVVMCDTTAAVEEARRRVSTVRTRLGLELHPEKTRLVDLSRGREGFDFLGCHLPKRMSGPIWERARRRVYYLHRWPSSRAMARVRARVRVLTPRSRCHEDLRRVIADVNPVLRGWAQYFRTGNAAMKFLQIDRDVVDRLHTLRRARAGSRGLLRYADDPRAFFEALGLVRLRGTIQYPGVAHATT
jgi:hypothetical protein